jgi:outer membrane receptor protein involved in Fe transport
MVYSPQTERGSFFNDQEREVNSVQWVEALSVARKWRGQHVFKFGTDLQRSQFTGFSASRPVEIRRLDGSLAELTVFGDRSAQQVSGFEFAVFAQDRWRVNSRVTFELGLRSDRDAVVEQVNWSPRAGVAIGVAPRGARFCAAASASSCSARRSTSRRFPRSSRAPSYGSRPRGAARPADRVRQPHRSRSAYA